MDPKAPQTFRLRGTLLIAAGRKEFVNKVHAYRQGNDLMILDGGPCSVGLESSVIDVSGNSTTLLRPGGISAERRGALLLR